MDTPFLLQPLKRHGLLDRDFPLGVYPDAPSERMFLQGEVEQGRLSWQRILQVLEEEWAIPWKVEEDWPADWAERLPLNLRKAAANTRVVVYSLAGLWAVVARHPSALAQFSDTGVLHELEWRPFLTLCEESAELSASRMEVAEVADYSFGDPLQQLLDESDSASISDIHLEPMDGGGGRIRRRRDGQMQDYGSWDSVRWKRLMASLLHRAHLPADRIRYPQEARIVSGNRSFRLSLIPALRGTAAVLRQLVDSAKHNSLGSLGMEAQMSERWQKLIDSTQGLLLIAGPTGAGKSTTVRALLQAANPLRRKILSLEDPVEIRIPGVQQISVGEAGRMAFGDAIRASLRQCPDVIFLGEIRDKESAAAALEISLTGHLVISTVHARSLTGAVWRLIELGVPPVNLASQLSGLLSQRLLRLKSGGRRAVFADWIPDVDDRAGIRSSNLPLRSAVDDFGPIHLVGSVSC